MQFFVIISPPHHTATYVTVVGGKKYNVNCNSLKIRIYRGMSPEKAIMSKEFINKEKYVKHEVNGELLILSEICKKYKIKRETLYWRINKYKILPNIAILTIKEIKLFLQSKIMDAKI